MQYTPHYNLNLPEGTDIVNPLVQDNPNYSAIDTALYDNKLRVVGTATHVKTGTNHAITLADSDINQFKFVATGDYATGDTFTVDGVTVTPRVTDGSTIPGGAFKINSTVLCALDGTILNLINVNGAVNASDVSYNGSDVESELDNINAILTNRSTYDNPLATGVNTTDAIIPADLSDYSYIMIDLENEYGAVYAEWFMPKSFFVARNTSLKAFQGEIYINGRNAAHAWYDGTNIHYWVSGTAGLKIIVFGVK